ncbi:MAG: hypothetical protein GF353_22485 [Candidatus Lokiarchaeota archaeon]|nr:hypothetical protein [Candidatus Lokiarchaeota archaeon]
MKQPKLYLIFLLLLSISITCNRNSTSPDAGHIFTGITETTVDGEILSEDPNDWKWDASEKEGDVIITGSYRLRPAFPNPTYNLPMLFQFEIPKQTFCNFYLVNEKMDTVKIFHSGLFVAGFFSVTWKLDNQSGERLPPGMYRCFFEIPDTTITGDILIKDYVTIKNTKYIDYAAEYYDISKWKSWYLNLTQSEQNSVRFMEDPIIKDEKFYEVIGKVNGAIVGWQDVPADIEYVEIFTQESAYRDEYRKLWAEGHN